MYTKRQLLQANRVSRFYESNESMSLSQIIKIIGKYISHLYLHFYINLPSNAVRHAQPSTESDELTVKQDFQS